MPEPSKRTEIGEIPEDWDVSTLGLICEEGGGCIQTGPFGSQLHANEYEAAGVPVINPTHLEGDRINHSDVPRVSPETSRRLQRHHVEPGDILFGRRGEIGRHGLVSDDEAGWLCGTGCFVVRVRHPKVDNAFLSYLFSTGNVIEWLTAHAAGTIMPNLNNTVMSDLPVVLPTIGEQRRLVAILSNLRRAVETESAICQGFAALKSGLLAKLFGEGLRGETLKEVEFGESPESWKVTPLSEVAEVQTGVAKGRRFDNSDVVEVPYLRVANVQDGHLDLSEMKTLQIRRAELERYTLRDGDVVLTEGGDFDKLGRGFIWRSELPLCIHQNHVFAVRTNRTVLKPEFFAYLAQSPYGKAYFLKVAHKTTNLACINSHKLKAFPVVIPSLEEQEQVVSILDAIDQKLTVHKRKHVVLDSLFKSLLQQLMTGAIRVKDLDHTEVSHA
jgi:type I restriction enzyme, S subunit